MCGISGFLSQRRSPDSFPTIIRTMLEGLIHRGPDEQGYVYDHRGAIGTARLSIIDRANGQQPMGDSEGRWWLSFSGEIYNYLELREELRLQGCNFLTQSDTEVVLWAWLTWGSSAFGRLNGCFALALYDSLSGRLILARDRYGLRPLFYWQSASEFVFASEMKSLKGFPKVTFEWDEPTLASILTIWTPLPDQTPFVGIHQVPLGSMLTIFEGKVELQSFEVPNHPKEIIDSWDDALTYTRQTMRSAVEVRLRSDVPVGTYLSGGLDSAIVAGMAARLSRHPLRTYSVTFADQQFDERDDQLELSEHFASDHTAIEITADDIVAAFPRAVWHAEMPLFRTAPVPMYLLAEKVRRQGMRVVLTGEGADESFLGYNIFKETLLRSWWKCAVKRQAREEILKGLYPYLTHFRGKNLRALTALLNRYSEPKQPLLFSHELRFHQASFSKRLLMTDADGMDPILAFCQRHQSQLEIRSPLERAQWLEFKTLLAGYLLSSQGDRMVLAHGVENRCPFLDPRMLAMADGLPREWKLNKGEEKYILKQAFADMLPARLRTKSKQPYRAPNAVAFLKARDTSYLEAILSETELAKMSFLDQPFTKRFLAKINRLRNQEQPRISPREEQTFMFLLSMALLNRYLVMDQAPPTTRSVSNWVSEKRLEKPTVNL